MDEILEFTVSSEDSKIRIDKYVSDNLPRISRTRVKNMIDNGEITVNDADIKSNYVVRDNDYIKVIIHPAEEISIEPEDIPLSVLYEDADILVVDKPKGMVVHPAPGHYSGTLVNAVLYHCKGELSGINGKIRPGIVHRIDKDTTGSLIICKNDNSHKKIAEQIASHSFKRIYEGIVIGKLKEQSGVINAPIGRDPNNRKRMAINHKNGKEAITHYKVIDEFEKYSYVEFTLETGRTHQIRVHMASIGHPLLGDDVYGPKRSAFKLQGQTLHAKTLGFIHPVNGNYIEINAPLPEYFEELLYKLRS